MQKPEKTLDTIIHVVKELSENQILQKLPGNCILAADLVQNMLYSHKINSRVVEVQVVFTRSGDGGKKLTHLLGYDNKFVASPNQHDTHVVVITETDPPYLVDASIGHIVDNLETVIVHEMSKSTDDIIAETVVNGCNIVYRLKKNIKLPFFHQRDMVEKLKQYVKIQKNLDFLKMIAISAVAMGVINFFFNLSLLILKLLNP